MVGTFLWASHWRQWTHLWRSQAKFNAPTEKFKSFVKVFLEIVPHIFFIARQKVWHHLFQYQNLLQTWKFWYILLINLMTFFTVFTVSRLQPQNFQSSFQNKKKIKNKCALLMGKENLMFYRQTLLFSERTPFETKIWAKYFLIGYSFCKSMQ